jgi:RNA polymerase sigma-70 factor (ECF subfamily)
MGYNIHVNPWETARAAWPGIDVDRERFNAFVAARATDGVTLHVKDLYLACACADGNPQALAAFDAQFLQRLGNSLSRGGSSPDTVQEVLQRLRVEILVRNGTRPPGIEGYRGRSGLSAWLQVVGGREAARVEKRARREILGDDDAVWVDIVTSDPELSYLKDVYRNQVVLALRAALDALDQDDMRLLRQNLVEGLSIDDIAARARVHRATAARWLERARENVAEGIRKELARRLRINADEIDQLLQLVRSRLDVSVRGVLGVTG